MATNVIITKDGDKKGRADAATLLKRFQKKMQESGVVPKVKSKKHFGRAHSKLKIKKDRLVKLESAKKFEFLKKMGKLQVRTFRPQQLLLSHRELQNQMQNNSIEIYNEVKKTPIKDWNFSYVKFDEIKDKILGKKFNLSVSILNPKNAQKVNKKMRSKTYTPNTLSFKYSKTSGEIVLCPEVFIKEDYGVGTKFENKILYLFIHSCLHLTDLDHGPKMDKLEAKFVKAFVV